MGYILIHSLTFVPRRAIKHKCLLLFFEVAKIQNKTDRANDAMSFFSSDTIIGCHSLYWRMFLSKTIFLVFRLTDVYCRSDFESNLRTQVIVVQTSNLL